MSLLIPFWSKGIGSGTFDRLDVRWLMAVPKIPECDRRLPT
ncbi:hypothetical protein [Chamaesiphon sp. OTE_75_metabat_556]|nr:hypothetical protein [Chamaesiphon sp. OTE_75_metabat_556]